MGDRNKNHRTGDAKARSVRSGLEVGAARQGWEDHVLLGGERKGPRHIGAFADHSYWAVPMLEAHFDFQGGAMQGSVQCSPHIEGRW